MKPSEAQAWKAYEEAMAPAKKAYMEAMALAKKARGEAMDLAWKAYEEATAPAWKAYEEATALAKKAREEATAPAWKAYQEATAPAWKAYEEAIAKLRRGNIKVKEVVTTTIDEAIKNLQQVVFVTPKESDPTLYEAISLGIAALELYKSCGHPTRCGMLTTLPGETEEVE